MSNEPIKPIEQNYVPFNELFPSYVSGGIEVKDDLIDPNNTYSSEKIEDRLDEVTSSLTQAIEAIDLSPYEQTINKNAVNGYAGLDSVGFVSINQIPQKIISSNFDFLKKEIEYEFFNHNSNILATTSGGSSVYSSLIYTSAFASGAGTASVNDLAYVNTISASKPAIGKPLIAVNPNSAGNVICRYYNNSNSYSINTSQSIIEFHTVVSISDFLNTIMYIGFGNITSNSSGVNAGSGLFLKFNDTVNSNNFQIVKFISGSETPTDTSITFTNNKRFLLSIIYNKNTEVAEFFIDRVSIGSITSVNLATNIYPFPIYYVHSKTNTQSGYRGMYLHSFYREIDFTNAF